MRRAIWVAGVLSGLAFGWASGNDRAPSPRPILKRLVLDDFEAPPGVRSYGILDRTLPARSRGSLPAGSPRVEGDRMDVHRVTVR